MKLNINNISIYTNFHPNRFINECARNKKLKSRKEFVYVKELTFLMKFLIFFRCNKFLNSEEKNEKNANNFSLFGVGLKENKRYNH